MCFTEDISGLRRREQNMNQKSNGYHAILKSANVVYPILIYFVVTTIAMNVFAMIAAGLGKDYNTQYMMMQTAVAAITIPFIYRYYKKDKKEPTVFHVHLLEVFQKKSWNEKVINGVLMLLAGAAAGIVLNNVIALTQLKNISEGFKEVTGYFFAGGIFFELLGSCLLVPILEEVLYRGVVYGRICDLMIYNEEETEEKQKKNRKNRVVAMLLTAFIFGMMHTNIVQFIYAALLGIILCWFVEKSGHLYGAIVAHIGANLIAVLRMETGIFQWMESSKNVFIIATCIFAVVVVILLVMIGKMEKILQKKYKYHS